jgi:hypothetical protein
MSIGQADWPLCLTLGCVLCSVVLLPVMWIDQPAGVGYSYGDKADYINNEDEVAEDLYQ